MLLSRKLILPCMTSANPWLYTRREATAISLSLAFPALRLVSKTYSIAYLFD